MEPSIRDVDYPADPYPGQRPDCSFVHLDNHGYRLTPDGAGGWRVGETPLDRWLEAHGVPGLAGRFAVLAYGSNACPSKITWLREELGLAGPVVVLRVHTVGLAAVWSVEGRHRDGQLPAVVVDWPGRIETHAVWLATEPQLRVLDVCEVRGFYYDLVRLRSGEIHTEDGAAVSEPFVYIGASPPRAPMLRRGSFVPINEVDQAAAQRLLAVGAAAGEIQAGDWRQTGLVTDPV